MRPFPSPLVMALTLLALAPASVRGEDSYLETQVKLRTPKQDSKRSREGGLEHVPFRIWIPEGVKTIRGLILNPMYTKAVTQKHWQAAGRHWRFGILGTNFFGAKHGEFPQLIDTALQTFAEQSGHAELIGAKMCLVGMSAGAGNCTRIAEHIPERTIAVGPVCLEVGPRNAASMAIPTMTIFGERDGKQYEKLTAKLPGIRAQGGLFSIAVQWRRRHEFGQANNLLLPLFDAAVRARLGAPGEPLKPFAQGNGWLGDVAHWRETDAVIAAYGEFSGDKTKAGWFPDANTARAWQAFVTREPKLVLATPPGLGDGQPLRIHKTGDAIPVQLAGPPPVSGAIEVYAGATRLGQLQQGRLTVTFSEPGFYPLFLQASQPNGTTYRSRPNTLIVQ